MLKNNLKSLQFLPLYIFANIVISSIFWPIFFTIFVLNSGVRLFVSYLLKMLYGSKYTLMEGCDATYTCKMGPKDPGSPLYSVLILNGKIDLEELRKKYSNACKLPAYKKLACCIDTKFGYSVWKEAKNFDIKKHVRYWEDPDDVIDEQKLYEIIGEYSVKSMPQDQPEWELIVVPQGVKLKDDCGKKTEKSSAIIYRMNHSYSDGFSYLIFMSQNLLDAPFEYKMDPTKNPPVPFWQNIYFYVSMGFFGPLNCISTIYKFITLSGKTKFSRTSFSQDSRALLNFAESVDFTTLKEIQESSKASITAIVYASVSAAMRKCHLKLHPTEMVPKMIQNSSQVIALVPYPKDKLYNGFAISFYPIPLAAESDDFDTSGNNELTDEHYKDLLKKCQRSGDNVMKFGSPLMVSKMTHLLSSFPKIVGQSIWNNGGTDVSLSNVPGPAKTAMMCGAEITQWFNIIPLINIGIGMVGYTHNGKFRLAISADQRVMKNYKNLEQFSKDITDTIKRYSKIYVKK